ILRFAYPRIYRIPPDLVCRHPGPIDLCLKVWTASAAKICRETCAKGNSQRNGLALVFVCLWLRAWAMHLCRGTLARGDMDQAYLRRFALRCRELMVRARSERAREQLCLWAEEFEARADAAEEPASDMPAAQTAQT